jgi:hypothetical protein
MYLLTMLKPVIGVLVVAAVATGGDAFWYEMGVRHRMTAGALHGALLLGAVGLVLGWLSNRLIQGLVAGVGAGVAGAMAFYGMVAVGGTRFSLVAMVAAWAAVWLMLAVLDGRWLRAPAMRPWSEIVTRGLVAAVLGGLAFYLMLDVLWGHDREADKNYLVQYGAWVIAWCPGILTLTLGSTGQRSQVRGHR